MKKTDFKFLHTFRVRYAEVDAQGIVFNAHYLTYFDCVITEYYRKLKYNYTLEVKKNKKDFHVIKTILEYKYQTPYNSSIKQVMSQKTSTSSFYQNQSKEFP